MKTSKEQCIVAILSILAPLLYLSMYLPIWGGKELLLANSGKPGIILFVFQCICLVIAILRLCLAKVRDSDSCLLTSVLAFFMVSSLVITCFFGFFFMLELFNVPWFPAQE